MKLPTPQPPPPVTQRPHRFGTGGGDLLPRSLWILVLGLIGAWIPGALGFSSDGSTLGRRFDRWMVQTNSAVIITASFTNNGAATQRGFFYSEQLPSDLLVTPLGVQINGRSLTNYSFESGWDGDVYAGYTPYRWVLEQPPTLPQSNPISPASFVQITYSVSSSSNGTFTLREFSWVGQFESSTNAAFGYSETVDQQIIGFVDTAPLAIMTASPATNGVVVHLAGQPGYSFQLQASDDLSSWLPMLTNTAPFDFTDLEAPYLPQRYYRALWLP